MTITAIRIPNVIPIIAGLDKVGNIMESMVVIPGVPLLVVSAFEVTIAKKIILVSVCLLKCLAD